MEQTALFPVDGGLMFSATRRSARRLAASMYISRRNCPPDKGIEARPGLRFTYSDVITHN